jgi:cytochrome c oxidase subunit 2
MRRRIAAIGLAILAGACSSHPAPATPSQELVVRITAKRFEYSPAEVHLKRGVPVVLELVSLDRTHGFDAPDLGLRSDIKPGEPTRLRFVPEKTGRFGFHCDVFCGSGHEDMTGEIVVDP